MTSRALDPDRASAMAVLDVEDDTATPPLERSASPWTVGGRRFLVLTWTAESFARLDKLDRKIIRRSGSRRLDDGSWQLLMAAS